MSWSRQYWQTGGPGPAYPPAPYPPTFNPPYHVPPPPIAPGFQPTLWYSHYIPYPYQPNPYQLNTEHHGHSSRSVSTHNSGNSQYNQPTYAPVVPDPRYTASQARETYLPHGAYTPAAPAPHLPPNPNTTTTPYGYQHPNPSFHTPTTQPQPWRPNGFFNPQWRANFQGHDQWPYGTPSALLQRQTSTSSHPHTPRNDPWLHNPQPWNFASPFPYDRPHSQPSQPPPSMSRPPSSSSRRGSIQEPRYQVSPDLASDLSLFPFLDWIVWRAPAQARKWVGQTRLGEINLHDPAVYPTVRELRINSTRVENTLRQAIRRWGCITVSAARKQPYVTVGDVLHEIYSYFRTPLSQREIATMPRHWRELIDESCRKRCSSESAEDVFPLHDAFVPGLRRCDSLLHDLRYAGLEIDPQFHQTRQLHLTLEDDRLRNSS